MEDVSKIKKIKRRLVDNIWKADERTVFAICVLMGIDTEDLGVSVTIQDNERDEAYRLL